MTDATTDRVPATAGAEANTGAGASEASGSASMHIAAPFDQLLKRARLDNFDAVQGHTGGHLMRRLPNRENWRLDLLHDDGRVRSAYLKKHHVRTVWTRLRVRLGLGQGVTPGRIEADNLASLQRHGVPSMQLIAFGERLRDDGTLESFLLTDELRGYSQLDDFLEARFPASSFSFDPDLNALIGRVADVARMFHELGYNHRDFYTCHFFIRESGAGCFDVNLIDLQRVQHRRYLRRRWLVKDLAQLAYSCPAYCISPGRRMAFFKRYLGLGKLGGKHKRLIRGILRKERNMKSKLGLYK